MSILIIFNPKSGKTKPKIKELITNFLIKNNYNYEIIETQKDLELSEYINVKNKNFDKIMAVGGDGTVSMVISWMTMNKIQKPLLILAAGTTNEVALSLELPANLRQNLELLNNDRVMEMDLGCMNEKDIFTYSLSFGNFTHLSYLTPQKLKNKLGYFAYGLYAVFSAYVFRLKKYELTCKVNGKTIQGSFFNGAITNSYSLGKIINYRKDEVVLDDGLLEMYLMKMPKKISEVFKIIKCIITNKYDREWFYLEKSDTFEFYMEKENSWNTDGEFLGKYKSVKVRSIKKGIQIIL